MVRITGNSTIHHIFRPPNTTRTNRAIFPLYAGYYTCCDARCPGDAGYELRTVVRPFGRPANCLIVGAGTSKGALAGTDRLIERLKALPRGTNVALPYLLEVKLGNELTRILEPAFKELRGEIKPKHDPKQSGPQFDFTRNAQLYFYTGDERFAQRARDAITSGGGAHHLDANDYSLENLAVAWRRVTVSPAFSAADRAKLDNRMYDTLETLSTAWWRIPPEKGIGNRHQTTGGLAWWTSVRLLRELGQPAKETRAQLDKWRREGQAYCDGLLRHYWDDEDDYQSADSIQNAASYALQAGRLDWFKQGLARRAAERLVMTVDNLGWYAGIQGYGDAMPGWERFPLDAGMFMGACSFVFQDGEYLGVLDRFPSLNDSWGSLQPWGLHQYDSGGRIKPKQPDWMSGLRVARFTPYKLDRINSGEFMTTKIMDNFQPVGFFARPVLPDLAFDKLTYRSGPAPEDFYMLFEGSSGTTLTTIDMNAIIRMTDAGKLWLVHNTGRRSLFFKNAVYVGKGTNQQPMAPSSELVASGDFGEVALAASRLPDCRGMTWTRNLLVLRDRFCAVIDGLRAKDAGDYTLSCAWRTPAWAAIRDGRWQATQDDVTFCLVPGSLDGIDSERPAQRDGATRPTTLRENRSLKAAPGDLVVFENVLYTTTAGKPRSYDMRQIAPGVVLIRDVGDDSLYMAAAGDRGIQTSILHSDAAVVMVTPKEIFLAGGTKVASGGMDWTTDSGRIQLKPEEAAKLRSALQGLWSRKSAPSDGGARAGKVATSGPTLPAGPKAHWQIAGPATRAGLVDGVRFIKGKNVTGLSLLATDWIMPLLVAEPRLMGRQGSELIRETREEQASVLKDAEPVLDPLKDAEFSLELPEQIRVADIDIFGDTFGQTSDPMPAGTLSIEMTFSTDGFKADRRVRRLDLKRRPTFHNLYKGHSYLFECYTAAGVNEDASAVRVRVLNGPSERLMITDVQVRSTEASRRIAVEARPIDLDGDGNDEVLTWTEDGDLAVLRPDGTRGWASRFPEGILVVDAWDLDGDGKREIFVSRLDRQVEVHNADGSPRWNKDFRNMKSETGGKYYGDGSSVYGMAVWQPKGAKEPEVLFTSYWFTARLNSEGRVIEAFRRSGHSARIRKVPDALPGGGGLAIRCDVPWPGGVPLQWWDVATGQLGFENTVPNGRPVYFEVDDYDGDGRPEALSANEQGIGLYAPRANGTLWEHMTDAPPVGVGVIRQKTGQAATLAYGRQDGYVFVMSADGKVLASTVLDEPLQCLTATGGAEPIIWVGTRTSLLGLRSKDLAPAWRLPGSYQHLTTQRVSGHDRVLAVTSTGQLESFDSARPQ